MGIGTETKRLVVAAVTDLTSGPDTTAAVETYFAHGFIQHSPICPPGRDGLAISVQYAKAIGGTYEAFRVLGDGDLVVVHARKSGLGDRPVVLFNLYRVAAGKIVEHWEALQREPMEPVGGRAMVDGPTEITDSELTDVHRGLVRRYTQAVLIDGEHRVLDDFVAADLVEHSPHLPDGSAALRTVLASPTDMPVHVMLHRIVAEGNFVFTLCEGAHLGSVYALYDLYRISNGKIAEHWSVTSDLSTASSNPHGFF